VDAVFQRPTNVMLGSVGDPSPVAALADGLVISAAATSAALAAAISAGRGALTPRSSPR
jgi:hypothetical protein